MPHARPEDLPAGGGGRWPFAGEMFRSVQWGDLEVGFTTVPEAPTNSEPMYALAGWAGGVCPCPHYGYILEGALRASYPGTDQPDEIARTGEIYFIPAGHLLNYDEPTKAIEFNPAHALAMCMDGVKRAVDTMTAQAQE